MSPLEALGWVLVAALAAFGLMAVLFVAVGLIVSIRKHWQLPTPIRPHIDASDTCGVKGPDGVVCQRAPHVVGSHGALTPDGLGRW